MKGTIMAALVLLLALGAAGCERAGLERGQQAGSSGEPAINRDLGTLRVSNQTDEPIAIHFNGRELYSVPPAREYLFRNMPLGTATIYGVGRISQKHYQTTRPTLEIEKGREYEWTINP